MFLKKLLFISIFLSINAVQIDYSRLNRIEYVVKEAIENEQIPGACVLVGIEDKILYKNAFGYKSIETNELMSTETIFDIASITKVFTAISIIILAEQGLIRLHDVISSYIPEFAQNGKEKVTIENLLLHTSGLKPANSLADYANNYEGALKAIYALPLDAPTNSKFIYSDLGYIILGELVQKITNQKLNVFIQQDILNPLKMHNTFYLPSEEMKKNIAPTEKRNNKWIQGEVHDPRAFLLGGVSGHAGLFSNLDDMAKLCKMFLNYGKLDDSRILSNFAVRKMLKINNLPDGVQRSFGFDIKSSYSTFLGDFADEAALGHTGFTGTSIVLDPSLNLFIIILSNRVHLKNGNAVALRAKIANIIYSSICIY